MIIGAGGIAIIALIGYFGINGIILTIENAIKDNKDKDEKKMIFNTNVIREGFFLFYDIIQLKIVQIPKKKNKL